MTTNESRRAASYVKPRDPLRMINSEGTITGTVVSATAMAATAGHLEETRLVLAISRNRLIHWLAHVHARALGDAVKHRTHAMDALKAALAETWPILAAALVPAVIVLVSQLLGAKIQPSAWIALIATTALLTIYSFWRAGAAGSASEAAC